MAVTQQEIEAIGKRWWPNYMIQVWPIVGTREQPETGFSFSVLDNGSHVVHPVNAETLDKLKDNVLKRVIETLVKQKWGDDVKCSIQGGSNFSWGDEPASERSHDWVVVVHIATSRQTFKAPTLDELVETVHEKLEEL